MARSGTGHGGKFMIFDIDTIDIWLTFLLSNMCVKFGDQVHRQIQGTPMGISINYMDVTIVIQRQHSSSSRITTVLYDKREHSPLADQFIIKFPHAMSNISAAAKYGVIISQYHRFRRIIMLRNDFTDRMAGLVHYMQSMGHDTSRMLKQIRELCTRLEAETGTNAS
ncbi:TPA: hypothetical protein ACH3X2_001883 [Trebouxia sp. C0005]